MHVFKAIVKLIVGSDEGQIIELDAIETRKKIPDALSKKKLEVQQIQAFLRQLCDSGWMEIQEDHICIGPRTLLELPQLFEALTCAECPVCNYHVVQGIRPCTQCEIKVHKHCAQRHRKLTRGNKCIECKQPWNTL